MTKHYLGETIGSVLLIVCISFAADCPIIFVHGQKGGSEAKPSEAWKDWNGSHYGLSGPAEPYRTAMDRIRIEGYGGYTAGSPFNCDKNSVLQPTGGNTRKIYNFSYYNPDGSKGVIGSNGHCLPEDYMDWRDKYEEALANASWASNLVEFIEKVLTACYGEQWPDNPNAKVDIVAHCMGGLVVRAAIKWYNFTYGGYSGMVRDRVRKLLLIATPNQGCDFKGDANAIQEIFFSHSDWQTHGEDLEMNVDPSYFKSDVYFEDNQGNKKKWCEFLDPNDNCGVNIAVISGNRQGPKSLFIPGEDDNMVAVNWVKMSCAQYNPTVFASHGVGDYHASNETFLQGCTYTEEFIKNWIIDDDVSHNGGVKK